MNSESTGVSRCSFEAIPLPKRSGDTWCGDRVIAVIIGRLTAHYYMPDASRACGVKSTTAPGLYMRAAK